MSKNNHLKALLRKQYIIWKRSPFCSICEILLPVFLASFLFLFRSTVDKENISELSYLSSNNVTFNLYNPDDVANSGSDKMDFFVNCINRTEKLVKSKFNPINMNCYILFFIFLEF